MPIDEGKGSQLAVIGTEHTLFTSTLNKNFFAEIDYSPMLSGDTLEIRVKKKVKSGGSSRTVRKWTILGAEVDTDNQVFYIPPIGSLYQYDLTIKQTAGTGRTFDWQVMSP